MLSKIDWGHPLVVMVSIVIAALGAFIVPGVLVLALDASKRHDMAACREMCAPLVPKFDGHACACVKP